MFFVDVHCHIDDALFDRDRHKVLERAKNSNVIAIISSALSPVSLERLFCLQKNYANYLYITSGWDPTLFPDPIMLETYQNYIKSNRKKIVGIGEVGLDFYYIRDESKRNRQIKLFRNWIHFSQELDLPLIVHSRSAGKYSVKILFEENAKKVVMHAYDGRPGWALKAAEHGYYFSIPTSIWHSVQKQKLVKFLPLESLLLETDSPVLAPFRDQRNEPSNIVYSAKKIAEIKNVELSVVANITTKNAFSLFKLQNTL